MSVVVEELLRVQAINDKNLNSEIETLPVPVFPE